MNTEWAKATAATVILALLVIAGIGVTEWRTEAPPMETFDNVADALFETYVLPFEVLSVLLLGALIAALYIGAKTRKEEGSQ